MIDKLDCKYQQNWGIVGSRLRLFTWKANLTVDYIRKYGMFSFSQETLTEFEEVLKRPKFDKFLYPRQNNYGHLLIG